MWLGATKQHHYITLRDLKGYFSSSSLLSVDLINQKQFGN